jgi:membrane protein YdbS with pleckstrin-like domain
MNIDQIKLESDEKILLQVRKHWFILALEFFGLALGATLPYFIYVAIESQEALSALFHANVPPGVVVSIYCAWLLIIWMSLFNIWNNYYLDVWTFTNKRLIAVDQKGFFSRTTASFKLERLQDIEISVTGILATFLDFGTLDMQTAGEERNFRATYLPSPGTLKSLVLRATDLLHEESRYHKHDGT